MAGIFDLFLRLNAPLVFTQMISSSAFARYVVISARFVSRFLLNHSRSIFNKLTHALFCLPVHLYQLHMKSRSTRSRKNWTFFLRALPEKMSLLSASPRNVCRFLVWKEKKGKTQVHSNKLSLYWQA